MFACAKNERHTCFPADIHVLKELLSNLEELAQAALQIEAGAA